MGKRMKGLNAWWHFSARHRKLRHACRSLSQLEGDLTSKYHRASNVMKLEVSTQSKSTRALWPQADDQLLQKQLQPRGKCHEEHPLSWKRQEPTRAGYGPAIETRWFFQFESVLFPSAVIGELRV